MISSRVADNGLVADFFTSPSSQHRRVVLMLGGSEGGKAWSRIKRPIEALVQRGYSVLSLAYFKAEGLPTSLEEIPLEYFEKAFVWLDGLGEVVSGEYAVLGGSKGAEGALLLASRYSQVKAVVAISPSSVVWQGIPASRFEIGQDTKSSWSWGGAGLPFLPYPPDTKKLDLILLRLAKMHQEALRNTEAVTTAAIQVEDIQGAILLVSGTRDRLWPASFMGDQIANRLKDKGFENHYEHIVYDSGHNGAIMNRDCWKKILDFLEVHYKA